MEASLHMCLTYMWVFLCLIPNVKYQHQRYKCHILVQVSSFQVDLPPRKHGPNSMNPHHHRILYFVFLLISSIELIFFHWLFVIPSSGCLHHLWPCLNTVAEYLFILVVVLSQWSYSLFSMIPQSIIWFVTFELCLSPLKTFTFCVAKSANFMLWLTRFYDILTLLIYSYIGI